MTPTFKTITVNTDVDAIDIPTMSKMSNDEYRDYLRGEGLMFINDGVLRSTAGGYPIATSREQIDALIEHLQRVFDSFPPTST